MSNIVTKISKYNAHTEPIIKELTLLKDNEIVQMQELKSYYKYKNNRLSYYLQNIPLHSNTDTHNYETHTQ